MQLAVLGLRCGTQALKLAGSVVAACKLRCSSVWGLSSSTRDWTYVPCIARWILNHWTTKEGPQRKFLMHLGVSCSCLISMLILNHVLPQRRLRMFSACCSTPHWNHLDNCQQLSLVRGFPGWCSGKQSPCQWKETQEMWVQSLGREDPLEEEMATHSFSCLGNPMDRGAWWATVHGVTQTEEPGRLLCVSHTHTHTHSLSACLCLSLFLCVSHCISLSVCLCLSFSLSLSLSPSIFLFWSEEEEDCAQANIRISLETQRMLHADAAAVSDLQLLWWWHLCGPRGSQDPVPVTTDSGAPGPSWVTLTCTELWSKEQESGECFFMLHLWAKNRGGLQQERTLELCLCTDVGQDLCWPCPADHTPAPAGWRDDWGAESGVSSGALLSKNSSEIFFFF